jgi:hypothetical protein
MADPWLLLLALLAAIWGMSLLALAMKPHWEQSRAPLPYPAARAPRLRALGCAALATSLVLCLAADHALLASLVWVMNLTVAALLVAFTLAFRPRWLGWSVAWLR